MTHQLGLILAATEHAAAEAGEAHAQPSLFAGDIGNVVWTLLIFALLLFVLGRYAWKPILSALKNREKFIHDSIESARREREESQKLLRQYTEQTEKARTEAAAIVDEGRRDAESVRKRIHEEARTEAEAMIARAKREIGIARDDAVKDVYQRSVALATNIAEKIVAKQLSPQDHGALLDQALAELEKVKG